jgi:hypothetical protein
MSIAGSGSRLSGCEGEMNGLKPFYWVKVHDDPKVSAPSGWYQWTERGLVYLGESILGSNVVQMRESRSTADER